MTDKGMLGVTMIAGAIGDMANTYYGAKMANATLRHQAFMSDLDAKQAELAAQTEMQRGVFDVGRITLAHKQRKGARRASMAAAGVDLTSASAIEVVASEELIKEIDVNTTMSNAVRAAYGYKTAAVNASNAAIIGRASSGANSPFAASMASLAGRSGSMAERWYTLNKMK